MYVHTYVCACTYVCMYACMYICSSSSSLSCFVTINDWGRPADLRLLSCMHVCMFVCTYACMYVRKCVCMHVCLCVYIINLRVSVCICIACVLVYVCFRVHVYVNWLQTHILQYHGSCKYSLDHCTLLHTYLQSIYTNFGHLLFDHMSVVEYITMIQIW